MPLKDKLILVFYIGCKNMSIVEANKRVIDARYSLDRLADDSAQFFFLPDFNSVNSKIENINPDYIDEKEYKNIEKRLKTISDAFKKIVKEHAI